MLAGPPVSPLSSPSTPLRELRPLSGAPFPLVLKWSTPGLLEAQAKPGLI